MPLWTATPRAHSPASLSARASHQRFSSTPQQDRVVDDAAVLGRDQHVLALPDGAFRQVAAGQRVRERRGVRPGDLDDPLHRDVPQRHVVEQRPVLLDRVARSSPAGTCGCRCRRRCSRPRGSSRRTASGDTTGRSRGSMSRSSRASSSGWPSVPPGGSKARMVGHARSIASRVPPDGRRVARGGRGGRGASPPAP